MSAVLVLTPIIIASWPAITAAVAGAASAMGMVVNEKVKEAARENQKTSEKTVEIELSESEIIAASITAEKEIVVSKGGIEIRIKRDNDGRCIVCAKGKGHSETELKQTAEQFSQKLTQCYIYDKVMRELKSKDFQVINEEVTKDESIRIHVRRWVD
jgi:hypothetical protein